MSDNVHALVNDFENRLDFDEKKIDNLAADARLILNQRLPEIRQDIRELREENRELADETRKGINRLGFWMMGSFLLIAVKLFFM